MDSANRSSRSSSESSSVASSASYAEMELGHCRSNLHLLRQNLEKNHPAFNGKGRKKSSKCIKAAAITSLVLSLVCVVCVALCLGWVFFVNGADEKLTGSEGRVCLPCLQVSPNPLDDEGKFADLWNDLEVVFQNDTRICCAQNTAQYAALFKLILQRQQEVQKIADALEPKGSEDGDYLAQEGPQVGVQHDAVSAHLLFKPASQRTTGSPGSSVQQWKSPRDSPMSHVKEGLKFHNNRLYIQSPGHYFIYCQVLFNPDADQSATIVSAYVQRHSILRPASSGILLKTRHTRHDVTQDRHSSYVGGVFELQQGDSLYVEVSAPELLSYDDVASFFGLFKVGE